MEGTDYSHQNPVDCIVCEASVLDESINPNDLVDFNVLSENDIEKIEQKQSVNLKEDENLEGISENRKEKSKSKKKKSPKKEGSQGKKKRQTQSAKKVKTNLDIILENSSNWFNIRNSRV